MGTLQTIVSRLEGKRVLIAGYGREGRSTHAFLNRYCHCAAIDIAENSEQIGAMCADGYDAVIKSPGVPLWVLEKCDAATITSQVSLFLLAFADQTVAVTGTKGKSTTTSLIFELLRQHNDDVILGGNIGIPLFDIIESIQPTTTIVAELSCHQLEILERAPHIGVLLNLFEEHLDHYTSYHAYQMAKMNIALCQQCDDHFFYCSDNPTVMERIAECGAALRSHQHPYCAADEERVLAQGAALIGSHNQSNMVVAAQVAHLFDVHDDAIHSVFATFHGLQHRLQKVGEYGGITFYNDSISTIPAATAAALAALPETDTLILGGFDRGIDYAPLTATLASTAVRNVVFVGKAGERILAHCQQQSGWMENHRVLVSSDYTAIVDWCFLHTAPGKICLLSPAAASYDQFTNFEHRGTTFMDLVKSHTL